MNYIVRFSLPVNMRYFALILSAVAFTLLSSSIADSATTARVGDKFGDWVLECRAIAAGKTNCSLTQTLVDKKSKRAIVKFALAKSGLKGKDIMFNAFLPLGIDISAGVLFSIDGAKPRSLPLKTCTRRGCLAQYKLDKNLLKAFKKGKGLTISFNLLAAKKKLTLPGSLSGISSGLKAAGLE